MKTHGTKTKTGMAFATVLLSLPLVAGLMQGTAGARPTSGNQCNGLSPNIVGTKSADTLVATPYDDVIWGGAGNDKIWGMGGNDVICGGAGADFIYGDGDGVTWTTDTPGNDTIIGDGDSDTLNGGPGADTINANDLKVDKVDGGTEIDTCKVDAGVDLVTGCP